MTKPRAPFPPEIQMTPLSGMGNSWRGYMLETSTTESLTFFDQHESAWSWNVDPDLWQIMIGPCWQPDTTWRRCASAHTCIDTLKTSNFRQTGEACLWLQAALQSARVIRMESRTIPPYRPQPACQIRGYAHRSFRRWSPEMLPRQFEPTKDSPHAGSTSEAQHVRSPFTMHSS